MRIIFTVLLLASGLFVQGQLPQKVISNLFQDSIGTYVLTPEGNRAYEARPASFPTLVQMIGTRTAYKDGVEIDFRNPSFNGLLYYGFIPYGDGIYPQPVYFRQAAQVVGGKAKLPIRSLSGRYDMIKWQTLGAGVIGYRVVNEKGAILYDGKVRFLYNPASDAFSVDNTVIEGPLVCQLTPTSATIRMVCDRPDPKVLKLKEVKEKKGEESKDLQYIVPNTEDLMRDTSSRDTNKRKAALRKLAQSPYFVWDFVANGLKPNTQYEVYTYGAPTIRFRTAPAAGSQLPFTFGYCSDSRSGNGGGERNLYGTNAYVVKKIGALAAQQGCKFLQFTGDLVSGYLTNQGEQSLQFANWKHALEPFWGRMLVVAGMGNHEAFSRLFEDRQNQTGYTFDKYPYADSSAEALFAQEFTNPVMGPKSEDGNRYDPRRDTVDFPPYAETIFSYSYSNVAMIVLNSNYWYTVQQKQVPHIGGNIHAYIMDNQLAFLAQQLDSLEKAPGIDHVFVTCHTPLFPNGGHVQDDMWYNGDNSFRPYIAGKPVQKGIIERRDQILDLCINRSTKVRATLTGDEHNYCRTRINEEMPRYPEGWALPKLKLTREIWQINNGSAGAPYYAQEQTPWSAFTEAFTTQTALVLIHVNGKQVSLEVLNPDTLETIDTMQLHE